MSASFVTDSLEKEKELYVDKCGQVDQVLSLIREGIDELSDNFTPENEEKIDKILNNLRMGLILSKSQESEDGLGQGKAE
tara:strand:+ start:364 stop:603 length:240 start_codon:yes stop_codon:yes gene_type:complete